MNKLIITIHCPDQKGIIAAITSFINENRGNIVYIDQYVDRENTVFFMRLECDFSNDEEGKNSFERKMKTELVPKYQLNYSIYEKTKKINTSLFVSKYNHCLYDILSRHQAGELPIEIPFIVSNHKDLELIAKQFNIPYYYIPVTKGNKKEAEKEQLKLLRQHKVETIILARYMQIISPELIEHYPNNIINIHHSFLPAFPGAKPYHSAYKRGVKIIGATSHYVTEELDAGPIIEQDITHVSHIHSVANFIAKGRDLERIVLSKALQLHAERKIMVYQNKTVVFS